MITMTDNEIERCGFMINKYVLVACEESQTVCKAFRDKGVYAFSCDIQDCSGGFPEWHIKDNVIPLFSGAVYYDN